MNSLTMYSDQILEETIPESLAMQVSFLLKRVRELKAELEAWAKANKEMEARLERQAKTNGEVEANLRREGTNWRARAEAAEVELKRLRSKGRRSK